MRRPVLCSPLGALDLEPEDAEKVRSLRRDNTAWSGGRMRQLSAGQEDLVKALEAEYHDQRVAAMERLARQLVVKVGADPVC